MPEPLTLRRLFVWAALLAGLYLPTLATRFDFADDGCLVYPHGDRPLGPYLRRVWATTVGDFEERGPFRPVLWAHLTAEAEWLWANAFAWRAVHLAWAVLAAAILLLLFRELRVPPAAAILAAALAMWNPYRGETWINLTVTEGVAMPYALAALACALRAARSTSPGYWDIAGGLCVLCALGCKNTFAAVVPAQVIMRLLGDGSCWREGIRRHGIRAALLALTLLLPVGHFLAYKLSWHAGRYATAGLSFAQLGRMLRTVRGAMSYEFMLPGVVLGLIALYRGRRNGCGDSQKEPLWPRYRVACFAAVALLVGGIGIYLPIDGVAGRYAIPAAWGADLLFAIFLSALAACSASRWRRCAFAAIIAGLVAVAAANLGKQDKFTARADLLWQTLECVERQAPAGACVAWCGGAELCWSEAVHFRHHLHARGRPDITLLVSDRTNGQRNIGSPGATAPPTFAVCEQDRPPDRGQWQLLRAFRISYWGRRRAYHCYLFQKTADAAPEGETVARGRGSER